MQLAFSLNAYLNFPVDDALRRVAEAGYRGVELLADVPHAWPAGLLPAQVDAIRRAIDESDLEISNINAFMMNAIADPRQPVLASEFGPIPTPTTERSAASTRSDRCGWRPNWARRTSQPNRAGPPLKGSRATRR